MRNETIAIHAGYEPDPTTNTVAEHVDDTVEYPDLALARACPDRGRFEAGRIGGKSANDTPV